MPLTADRIVTRACELASVPGYVAQAQDYLNRFLENLAQNYDFPSAAYTFTNFTISPNAGTGVNLPAGSWYNLQLPTSSVLVQNNAQYLRTHSVFYNVSGQVFYLMQIALEDYDKLFQGGGIQNYPYAYVVDSTGTPNLATVQMAFYNPPAQALQLTIRNQYQPNDITAAQFAAGATIPWFPNQDLLILGTAEMLMRTAKDARQESYFKQIYGDGRDPGMLSRYLRMVDDKENFASTIKRDRRMFKNPAVLPATKTTVWMRQWQ